MPSQSSTASDQQNPPRRFSRMRRKAVVGGVVGAVLAGIYFLSSLLPSGLGFGLGSGSNAPSSNSNDANTTEKPVEPPEEKPIEAANIIKVLIDGEEYKVLKSPNAAQYMMENYRKASISEILTLAKAAPGEDGIKVWIGWRSNVTQESKSDLSEALKKAGFRENEDYVWAMTKVP